MSTTEALLGNLTEIPAINACYCFQILTYVIVLTKKTYQPGVDYVARRCRHFVTGGACNEFSGAILKRQTAAIAKCYKLFCHFMRKKSAEDTVAGT